MELSNGRAVEGFVQRTKGRENVTGGVTVAFVTLLDDYTGW